MHWELTGAAEKRLLIYLGSAVLSALVLLLSLTNGAYRYDEEQLSGPLVAKVRYYQDNAANFDTVFLGDSRTYCAIHPYRMNQLLNARVANLASWAHWLPTQYAQFEDLVNYIPPDTTVVWSVGYQNFHLCEGCGTLAYPIGSDNTKFYAQLGIPKSVYEENVRKLRPLSPTPALAGHGLPHLYDGLVRWFETPLLAGSAITANGLELDLPSRLTQLRAYDHVANASARYSVDTATSVEVRFKHGGYERIELDHEFFRIKQRAQQRKVATARERIEISPAYLGLFEAGLDLFAANGVHVIVSVFEESPHMYRTRRAHLDRRHLMDTVVRDEVEERGFDYVHVDFDQLDSTMYFDYNHLNSSGADLFSRLLAAQLRKLKAMQVREMDLANAL